MEPFDIEPFDIEPFDMEPFDMEPPAMLLSPVEPLADVPPDIDPPVDDPLDIGAFDELSVGLVPVGDALLVGSVCGAVVGELLCPEGAAVCASAGAVIAAAAASRMSFMGNLRQIQRK